jgi:hypothetical protein
MHTYVWRTPVAVSRVTAIISAVLFCVSCGSPQQGHWTKQGVSQAFTNEQYAADSQHCDRFAVQNDGRVSEKAREKRYTKCMAAQGYQWVAKESVSLPEQSRGSFARSHPCPVGSINCIQGETNAGGPHPEVNQSITLDEGPQPNPANLPPSLSQRLNTHTPRPVAEQECRHEADASLSSSYAVYVNCMQGKGWPPASPIEATPDTAENGNPDPDTRPMLANIGSSLQSAGSNIREELSQIGSEIRNMFTTNPAEHETTAPHNGLTLKDVGRGLKSAAKNIGDEIPKIGSAVANMFTLDSIGNDKADAEGLTLEDIGRGLQSAARNIGDEIPKMGSAIVNMFKQLGNHDTLDKDKDR